MSFESNGFIVNRKKFSPYVDKISASLKLDVDNYKCIGVNLNNIRKKGKQVPELKSLHQTQYDYAFYQFIRANFQIGKRRALEYMTVATHPTISKLKIHLSCLIELARLDGKELKALLKKNPKAKLEKMTFRELKELVRPFNANSRKPDASFTPEKVEKFFSRLVGNDEDVQKLKHLHDLEKWIIAEKAKIQVKVAMILPKDSENTAQAR